VGWFSIYWFSVRGSGIKKTNADVGILSCPFCEVCFAGYTAVPANPDDAHKRTSNDPTYAEMRHVYCKNEEVPVQIEKPAASPDAENCTLIPHLDRYDRLNCCKSEITQQPLFQYPPSRDPDSAA